MPPRTPTRTDAYVACLCGGTMSITVVAPIPDEPNKMSHTYVCLDCGGEEKFEVTKKTIGDWG